jgi:hypothetical protein
MIDQELKRSKVEPTKRRRWGTRLLLVDDTSRHSAPEHGLEVPDLRLAIHLFLNITVED